VIIIHLEQTNKAEASSLLLKDFYLQSLQTISGISFTHREIEIIACLLSGRGYKKIGALLKISSKTVEIHVRNIMLKIKCNSKENIIDFTEKSDKYPLLKQYYTSLLVGKGFEFELERLSRLNKMDRVDCLILYEEQLRGRTSLINKLQQDLNAIGIVTCSAIPSKNKVENFLFNKHGSPKARYIIYIITNETAEQAQTNKLNVEDILNLISTINKQQLLIVLLDNTYPFSMQGTSRQDIPLNFKKTENYPLVFYELLKILVPDHNFEKNILDFNKLTTTMREASITQKAIDKYNLTETTIIENKKLSLKWILPLISVFALMAFGYCFNINTESLTSELKMLKTQESVENTQLSVASSYSDFFTNQKKPEKKITWNLPFPNYYFTGRTAELEELVTRFTAKDSQAPTVALVACNGMGGVGKTEIAKYFIHNVENLSKKKYRSKVWFDSEKIDKLIEQYIKLARFLKIDIKNTDNEEIIVKVKQWFEMHPDWIIVYDNVETMESIIRLLPQRGGDILITSRNPNWQNVVAIDTMTEKEAMALIKGITHKPDDEKDIKTLVNMLGKLPLAVAQAGAYIERKGISVKSYLDEYEQEQQRLLMDESMPPGTNHPSVNITFSLSVESIKRISFDAYSLINCLAYLDPNSIYRKDLARFISNENSKVGATSVALNSAMQVLRDYSLISVNRNQSVAIHRLVQLVTWYRQLNKKENNDWLFKVLDAINGNIAEDNQLALGGVAPAKQDT